MKSRLVLLPAAATACTLAACETETESSVSEPEVIVETMGDTTVVRTLSGSVWGAEATLVPEVSIGELDGPEEYLFGRVSSIAVDDDRTVYAFDRQAQHVLVYDSLGTYVQTLGRPGEGPGEFSRAEAIALLPDGRLVVRNPGNQRVEVFGPEAGQTDQWGYPAAGLHAMSPLYTDENGRTFVHAPDNSQDDLIVFLVVMGPDGTLIDTLPQPSSAYEPPELTAQQGGLSASRYVPFSPEFVWTVHPSGHFLTGLSSDYRIDLPREDGVLRIERAARPAPVHDEERAYERELMTDYMRDMVPDWDWNGPPIPDHKSFFHELLAGRDGRIWVRLATEARPFENENHDPEDPSSRSVVWREPLRYDVFEPDGTYLGVVAPPDDLTPWVDPVFDGDYVWAVTRDDLGVERVVRYRIEVGGG